RVGSTVACGMANGCNSSYQFQNPTGIGSLGDTSIINMAAGGGPADPGTLVGTTEIRLLRVRITRSGAGTWGCVPNHLGFYIGTSGQGLKLQTSISMWNTSGLSTTVSNSLGTHIATTNNQTPVVTVNPLPASTCANGNASFSVTAVSANPGAPAIT